ncbi:MAG: type II secretion system F family protein [Planctomycetota bacterium]|nr:MAG: type II secretion system F family protein [Planctomycetota bacterium]
MAARIQRKVPAASRARSGRGASAPAGESGRKVRRKVPLKHLVRFTRLLATLTEAGLPLLRNLKILSDQWPPGRFRDTILDTAEMVEEGQPLSESMSHHPEVYDDLYVNMVKAGEAGGVLDTVLNRLADFQERAQSLRDRTRGAMIYPVVIFSVAFLVVAGLMIFVIPKFSELYQEMDITLPGITVALIDASEFVKLYWYLVLGLPVAFLLLYQFLYLRSYGFRRWNHSVWMRLPLFGSLIRTGQISRFASTFGTLVASGVPHLQAFDIVRGSMTNLVYREAMEVVEEEVREGESIAASLDATEVFDDVTVSMVEVGEETGELDRMCLRVGSNYEESFNRSLDVLLKLIEPLLLVLMALVVAVIAMALFLPLFKLLETFGQAA